MEEQIFLNENDTAEAKSYNSHHGPTYRVKICTKKNGTHVNSSKRTYSNHTKSDNLYTN